jgi:hypothetical protein
LLAKKFTLSAVFAFSVFIVYGCNDNSGSSSQNSENGNNQLVAQQPVPTSQDGGAAQSISDEQDQEGIHGLNALITNGLAFNPGSYAKGSIREGAYIFISRRGG